MNGGKQLQASARVSEVVRSIIFFSCEARLPYKERLTRWGEWRTRDGEIEREGVRISGVVERGRRVRK